MKKIIQKFTVATLLFFTLTTASAQYEQKFTLHGSFGFAMPTGTQEFYVDGDTYPYLFSNFGTGINVSGGIQYNINRRFSIAGNIGFMSHWGWYYSDIIFVEDVGLWNLQIGVAPKLYLMPSKKINPYIFAEVNLNYTDLFVDFGTESLDEGYPGLGFYPGLGIDFRISDNFGIFTQAGFNTILINEDPYALEMYENYNAYKVEVGVKISFLKSKTI